MVLPWHAAHHTQGTGTLYQGRFKSFPVADDDHYLRLVRYVERNALRAGPVRSASRWRWSSLGRAAFALPGPPLDDGPVAKPANWLAWVNEPETEAELSALRRSVQRGSPYGKEAWQMATARKLGLESTLRPPGRPKADQKTTQK